ncbi:MAG TPA: NAD-dependent epimerase/dehydratase family protein [Ktedonobacterales bacterium]
MRILLIGGTSFMGPAVARELLAGGHTVAVYHRGQTERDVPEGVEHIHGEREALAENRPALERFAPDVAIHMIAMLEAHAAGFIEALSGLAARGVVISSQDVYRAYGRIIGVEPGEPDPIPLTEDSPLRERLYPYRGAEPRAVDDPMRWMDDYDKIPVERLALASATLPCAVLRLPAVYGPGDRQRRFHSFLRRMDDGRAVIPLDAGEADWRWTHAYVEDVAHAIALAALAPRSAGRVYNVGEERTPTLEERALAVGAAAGWHGRVARVPAGRLPEAMRAGVDARQPLVSASGRIRAELGYSEPTPLDIAYARTIAWERANPATDDDPAAFDYAAEDAALAEQDS